MSSSNCLIVLHKSLSIKFIYIYIYIGTIYKTRMNIRHNLPTLSISHSAQYTSRARAEPDGTRAETTFRLSPKRTSPFKSAGGGSVQSTAGSRGVRITVSNAGYTTFRGRVRVLATHSIRQFPLQFPSRASPCATTFRTQYNTKLNAIPYTGQTQHTELHWPGALDY